MRPPGHAETTPRAWEARERLKTSAAHRSAAMAGGARPDPFRTRKLSRRAPMVLRGQPVGEQGAADRWTALDPFRAGRGGAAGDHLRGAPFPFSPYRSAEGPSGALFSCRGSAGPSAASPGRPFAGRAGPSMSAAGAGRRLPRGAPPFSRGRSRRRGGARPAGSRGAVPPAAPAGQGPGARPAGTVRGRRFSCREPGRPPCPLPV